MEFKWSAKLGRVIVDPALAALFMRRLGSGWVYIPINLIICSGLAVVAWRHYEFRYSVGAVITTALLFTPVIVALAPVVRGRIWGATFCLLAGALLLLGNPVKLEILRAPLSIADLEALPVLFKVMAGEHLLQATSFLAALLVFLISMMRLSRGTLVSVGLASLYVALLPSLVGWISPLLDVAMPIHAEERRMYGGEIVKATQSEDPIAFLQSRGPLVYLAIEWAGIRAENGGPSREEVEALALKPWRSPSQAPTRNVHLVLLESLWDASLLAHHRTDQDPIDPRFRAAWEATGRAYALSPVFGGATANAEFEVLCGFPAPRGAVAFVNRLRKDSPCLPAALRALGYLTVASHAHDESNWNRVSAYRKVGFNVYRPISAFELDDMEGHYLYDGSFFRQNLEYLSLRPVDQPIFNYQVSLSSHWAYSRNLVKRPNLIKVSPANLPLLNDYVNAVAYTTSAFMSWSEEILARDPDAIIVAFGDHAPVLSKSAFGPDPYSSVNAADSQVFDNEGSRAQLGMARTPLLVIDGKRGPVRLPKDTPLYEVPKLISSLLGVGELLPQSAQTVPLKVRPFLGHLLAGIDGVWKNCTETSVEAFSTTCVRARAHVELLRTLRRDTVLGGGHFIRRMNAHAIVVNSIRLGMQVERVWSSCGFEVQQFSPQRGVIGVGFNVREGGASSMWIEMKRLRGKPILRVGEIAADAVYGPKVITGTFNDASLYASRRVLPVTLQCDGEEPSVIGHISIDAQAPTQ